MTAPVLPHVMRDMSEALVFGTETWRTWMHSWLKKFMLQHRYFDAGKFGFVTNLTEVPVVPSETPKEAFDYPIEDIAPPAPQTPVKAKRGRPKKQAS